MWRSKSKDLTFDMIGCFCGCKRIRKIFYIKEREREREIEMERKRLMGSASMCKTGREKERRERERVIDVYYCIGKQLPRCLRASSCYRQLHWCPHVHVSWSHSPAKLAGTVTVCVRERESHTRCQ